MYWMGNKKVRERNMAPEEEIDFHNLSKCDDHGDFEPPTPQSAGAKEPFFDLFSMVLPRPWLRSPQRR